MTVRDLIRTRAWLAALAGAAVATAAPALPDLPIAGLPPVPPTAPPPGAALPPLVLPISADVTPPRKRETAPAPTPVSVAVVPPKPPVVIVEPAVPPKTVIKEVARTIPPDPPKVTGPATTTRPTRFQADAPAIDIRPGAKVVDATAALDAAVLDARSAFARVRDYSCHFLRQERVRGKLLPEQTAELYARTAPASVALKVIAPPAAAGAEAVSVAGRHAGKVRVKPAGGHGPQAWVSLDPSDPKATADCRHTAAGVGIGAVLDRLDRIIATERRLRNPVAVVASEYVFAGRSVVRYELILDRPHALRYAARVVVYADKETKLPVRFEAYDQPTAAQPAGELLESHSFVNVKLNPGVGDAVFDK